MTRAHLPCPSPLSPHPSPPLAPWPLVPGPWPLALVPAVMGDGGGPRGEAIWHLACGMWHVAVGTCPLALCLCSFFSFLPLSRFAPPGMSTTQPWPPEPGVQRDGPTSSATPATGANRRRWPLDLPLCRANGWRHKATGRGPWAVGRGPLISHLSPLNLSPPTSTTTTTTHPTPISHILRCRPPPNPEPPPWEGHKAQAHKQAGWQGRPPSWHSIIA